MYQSESEPVLGSNFYLPVFENYLVADFANCDYRISSSGPDGWTTFKPSRKLYAMESLLVIFGEESEPDLKVSPEWHEFPTIVSKWKIETRKNNEDEYVVYGRDISQLAPIVNVDGTNFYGEICYSTKFSLEYGYYCCIDLGNVSGSVHLFINGKDKGKRFF